MTMTTIEDLGISNRIVSGTNCLIEYQLQEDDGKHKLSSSTSFGSNSQKKVHVTTTTRSGWRNKSSFCLSCKILDNPINFLPCIAFWMILLMMLSSFSCFNVMISEAASLPSLQSYYLASLSSSKVTRVSSSNASSASSLPLTSKKREGMCIFFSRKDEYHFSHV